MPGLADLDAVAASLKTAYNTAITTITTSPPPVINTVTNNSGVFTITFEVATSSQSQVTEIKFSPNSLPPVLANIAALSGRDYAGLAHQHQNSIVGGRGGTPTGESCLNVVNILGSLGAVLQTFGCFRTCRADLCEAAGCLDAKALGECLGPSIHQLVDA